MIRPKDDFEYKLKIIGTASLLDLLGMMAETPPKAATAGKTTTTSIATPTVVCATILFLGLIASFASFAKAPRNGILD